MATKIEFRINSKGQVHMEISGVEGMSCEEITKRFRDALGITTDNEVKPEYFVELEGMNIYVNEE